MGSWVALETGLPGDLNIHIYIIFIVHIYGTYSNSTRFPNTFVICDIWKSVPFEVGSEPCTDTSHVGVVMASLRSPTNS